MQITIDTSDIIGEEATIRGEIIDQVSNYLFTYLRKEADKVFLETLNAQLTAVVKDSVSNAMAIHLDTEFTETDGYGRIGKKGTVRNRIADAVKDQCVYKRSQYASDMNAFSNTIVETVKIEVEKFKNEFNSLVTKQVVEQSMTMAVATLKQSLGIK
jgi:hypothetical protein